MLTDKRREYYEKSIKQYKMFSKFSIIIMLMPIGVLIYCIERNTSKAPFSLNTLITGMFFFVVTWVAYMSFNIKADILQDILDSHESDKDVSESEKDKN